MAHKNVRWGNFDLSELLEMRFDEDEFEQFSLKKSDIVICEGAKPRLCAIFRFASDASSSEGEPEAFIETRRR